MGAGHAYALYLEGDSPVHQLPVEVKIVSAFAFTVAVVATPRDTFWTFAVYAVVLLLVWRVAQIQLRWILPRMGFELPFVILAVLLPFTEGGERTTVLGVSVSLFGLQAAWGILVKGTLGLMTALTLAATTHRHDMPLGLSRLRISGMATTIVVLMLRYADLLAGEALRMRRARLSRGDDPRTIQQIGATARGVGGLFVRSYERGERVHLAMLSRGFTGKIPDLGFPPASRRSWMFGLTPAIAATAVSCVAHLGVLR